MEVQTKISYLILYSAVLNKRTVWNNRAGYYIGLFGYYIKNYFLFNTQDWKKNPKINRRGTTFIRDYRVIIYVEKFLRFYLGVGALNKLPKCPVPTSVECTFSDTKIELT